MQEIRIHGRGGQGSVTAAYLIAKAAFYDKMISQAFPNFGVERSGAPVEAFARISEKEIHTRSQIVNPEFIIVQDATLLSVVNVFGGIQKETIVMINSNKPIAELPGLPKGVKIYLVPATETALEILGRPIVNTLLLGYFAAITKEISLDSVKQAVSERFSGEIQKKNLIAVEKAFHDAENLEPQILAGNFEAPYFTKKEEDLTQTIVEPGSTMNNKTGSWKTFKPVFNHDTCINCGKCEMNCPDGCIFEVKNETNANGKNFRESDLDYCKGCGICETVCPVKAITMELEEK